MVKDRTYPEIFLIALAVATASFFGWMIYNGIKELVPALSELEPIWMVIVGLVGITILVKLGLRKQPDLR